MQLLCRHRRRPDRCRVYRGAVCPGWSLGRSDEVIAVASLHPHAGEGGAFGRAELEVIGPALAEARAGGTPGSKHCSLRWNQPERGAARDPYQCRSRPGV
ncbi:MAG TPA: hypothetical protein DCM14_07210 [Clostridiales bacterium UBA8153]|nr:hypothetical protein [Clostridiales bacterium UBA8153]